MSNSNSSKKIIEKGQSLTVPNASSSMMQGRQQDRNVDHVRQIVGDNPELTVQLLQKWLNEDQ